MSSDELMWVIAFGYILGRLGYSIILGIIQGIVVSFAKKKDGVQ
jgi:hypothetical protein